MKSATLLFSALLTTAVLVDAGEQCLSKCRTHLLQMSEGDCARWREELPRPDLYNHCSVGYTQGREASCKQFCKAHPDDHLLDSKRLDACAEFHGRPPSERVSACNEGFVQARTRARKMRDDGGLEEDEDVVAVKEMEPKRTVSAKPQTSPKSLLEAAREEAAAAFQGAKSTEL